MYGVNISKSMQSSEELFKDLYQLEKEGKIKKPDHELNDEEKFEYDKNVTLELSKKRKKLEFNGKLSDTILNIVFGSGFTLFALLVALAPGKHAHGPIWVAPWYVWVAVTAVLLVSVICLFAYSANYVIDLNKRKLIKETKFFNYRRNYDITNLDRINLFGASTEVSCSIDNNTKKKRFSYLYKIIAFYDSDNKQAIVESGCLLDGTKKWELNNINTKIAVAAELVECEYIPCDGSTKIELRKGSPTTPIQSLIVQIPKTKQCPELVTKKDVKLSPVVTVCVFIITSIIIILSGLMIYYQLR